MLCENCQKNAASVHMTSFVGGRMQTVHLCGQCAAQKKSAVVVPWFSFNDFLSAFYEAGDATDTKCEVCGTTLSSFKSCGKLGCANCYKVFEQNIIPVLKGIHMNTVHTGKRPGELVHTETVREEEPAPDLKEQLKKKLCEAVAAENFEEAARLRDEIAALDKGEEK